MKEWEKLDYSLSEILVSSGGRPLIYATYRAICDKGDKVIMQCLHGTIIIILIL
jgi:aspartate aminotransferase